MLRVQFQEERRSVDALAMARKRQFLFDTFEASIVGYKWGADYEMQVFCREHRRKPGKNYRVRSPSNPTLSSRQ